MNSELLHQIIEEITDFATSRETPTSRLQAAAILLMKEREQNSLWRERFRTEVKKAVAGLRISDD